MGDQVIPDYRPLTMGALSARRGLKDATGAKARASAGPKACAPAIPRQARPCLTSRAFEMAGLRRTSRKRCAPPVTQSYGGSPMSQTPAEMRAAFYSLPPEAYTDRSTVAAVRHVSETTVEKEATKGGGVPYMRIGRKALYKKADVLAWMERAGRAVEGTSTQGVAA